MNIAILGAGRIAGTMAKTINQMDEVNLYAVASRSLERAENFAINILVVSFFLTF